jgi:hypothetical protein
MNQCPCGHMGHPRERCRCAASPSARYHHELSGPRWIGSSIMEFSPSQRLYAVSIVFICLRAPPLAGFS